MQSDRKKLRDFNQIPHSDVKLGMDNKLKSERKYQQKQNIFGKPYQPQIQRFQHLQAIAQSNPSMIEFKSAFPLLEEHLQAFNLFTSDYLPNFEMTPYELKNYDLHLTQPSTGIDMKHQNLVFINVNCLSSQEQQQQSLKDFGTQPNNEGKNFKNWPN